VRVPSGELVQRVYGVALPSGRGAVAVDFDNLSRAPCSIAAFLAAERGRLRLERETLWLDATRVLTFASPPRLWAAGHDVHEVVRSGRATAKNPAAWNAPVTVALLAPVPHGTVLRTALTAEAIDLRVLPGPEAVERGWQRQLDRGLRTELPEPLQTQTDGWRADLLLAPPSAAALVDLEEWGFDREAEAMWHRLSLRDRRRARRRRTVGSPLADLRSRLVREEVAHVDILPGFAPEWLGQNVAVHDVPRHGGSLSFAVRWHGPRPALLWDAPAGTTLRAPGLDPTWSSDRPRGEALLAAPPAPLLAMGRAERAGDPVDDPGSFA
jgi:hypothetical protein